MTGGRLDRRGFLGATAAGAASLAFPRAAGSAQRTRMPAGLPSPQRMRADIQRMVDFGPRYTGTAGHDAYVDWLEEELAAAGCVMLPRDHFDLVVWEAQRYGLNLLDGPQAGPVQIASYYPRSKETPEAGLTGPLVYAGVAPVPAVNRLDGLSAALSAYPDQLASWASGLSGTLPGLRPGAILLVDVPMPLPLTTGVFLGLSTHLQWTGHNIGDWLFGDFKRTALAPGITGVPLAPFKALGAAGVVFILDAPADAIDGGYMPFENAFEDIPALFTDRETGRHLRAAAAANPTARLTLTATRRKGASPAIMGYLPGRSSQESIVLDTHTDGEGFVEENGGVGLVQLARHFGSVPPSQRLRRNLVFSLWPGHMASGMPQLGGIIDRHPDLVRSAAAAITVEHLGCSEWIDTADRGYHATGEADLFTVFTTQGRVFEETRAATVAHDLPHTMLLRPTVQFGVGGAFQGAGVPQVGYLAGPYYLLNDNATSDMEKLDEVLAAKQIAWTADLVRRFDAIPAADLASGDPSLGKKSSGPLAKFPPAPKLAFGVRLRSRTAGTVRLNRTGIVHLKAVLHHKRGSKPVSTTLAAQTLRVPGPGTVGFSLALRKAPPGRLVVEARYREAGVTHVRRARPKG